ncbi:hypothetical protein KEM48_008535 [Puccinia striiformis f. sp. tritici PST-130]|nr:hypothetical protein KEM48_008535 [Puccinia striiformis f. sp. tritici PST-130]
MLTHLHNRRNDTNSPTSRGEITLKQEDLASAPVNPIGNQPRPVANQVLVNNSTTHAVVNQVPLNTTNTHAPTASVTAPNAAGVPTGISSAPSSINTVTTSPSGSTGSSRMPTISTSTGLPGTRPALESNAPGYNSAGLATHQHTSTGMIVAIGLSGVAITLMLMILIRFLVKCMRKKTQEEPAEDTFIIPPTSFLDHPKNQEIGGIGASPAPMINRSASTSSVQSNMSIRKTKDQTNLTFVNQPTITANSPVPHPLRWNSFNTLRLLFRNRKHGMAAGQHKQAVHTSTKPTLPDSFIDNHILSASSPTCVEKHKAPTRTLTNPTTFSTVRNAIPSHCTNISDPHYSTPSAGENSLDTVQFSSQ